MTEISNSITWTLESQRLDFSKRKFLATPLAGMILWALIGASGILLPQTITEIVLFMGTGSIVYVAMFLSRFTGENFMAKKEKGNTFDSLFLFSVGQALLVYAIAIPFYLIYPDSLPLSVGILTGLMWLPFSWIIGHWIGIFHAIVRTSGILAIWYALPNFRFVLIPFFIVAIYMVTLTILNKRA
ncbi:MAG: hypothetical protein AAGB24_15490 [Bacteroidota bacterium]